MHKKRKTKNSPLPCGTAADISATVPMQTKKRRAADGSVMAAVAVSCSSSPSSKGMTPAVSPKTQSQELFLRVFRDLRDVSFSTLPHVLQAIFEYSRPYLGELESTLTPDYDHDNEDDLKFVVATKETVLAYSCRFDRYQERFVKDETATKKVKQMPTTFRNKFYPTTDCTIVVGFGEYDGVEYKTSHASVFSELKVLETNKNQLPHSSLLAHGAVLVHGENILVHPDSDIMMLRENGSIATVCDAANRVFGEVGCVELICRPLPNVVFVVGRHAASSSRPRYSVIVMSCDGTCPYGGLVLQCADGEDLGDNTTSLDITRGPTDAQKNERLDFNRAFALVPFRGSVIVLTTGGRLFLLTFDDRYYYTRHLSQFPRIPWDNYVSAAFVHAGWLFVSTHCSLDKWRGPSKRIGGVYQFSIRGLEAIHASMPGRWPSTALPSSPPLSPHSSIDITQPRVSTLCAQERSPATNTGLYPKRVPATLRERQTIEVFDSTGFTRLLNPDLVQLVFEYSQISYGEIEDFQELPFLPSGELVQFKDEVWYRGCYVFQAFTEAFGPAERDTASAFRESVNGLGVAWSDSTGTLFETSDGDFIDRSERSGAEVRFKRPVTEMSRSYTGRLRIRRSPGSRSFAFEAKTTATLSQLLMIYDGKTEISSLPLFPTNWAWIPSTDSGSLFLSSYDKSAEFWEMCPTKREVVAYPLEFLEGPCNYPLTNVAVHFIYRIRNGMMLMCDNQGDCYVISHDRGHISVVRVFTLKFPSRENYAENSLPQAVCGDHLLLFYRKKMPTWCLHGKRHSHEPLGAYVQVSLRGLQRDSRLQSMETVSS